ncbi:MAG TPA: hypothetical protein VLB82_11865 [Thermodesulfobacteriota bacterium]|nr:hypothetical protein [Thermodesulfobacteriota bacterium]
MYNRTCNYCAKRFHHCSSCGISLDDWIMDESIIEKFCSKECYDRYNIEAESTDFIKKLLNSHNITVKENDDPLVKDINHLIYLKIENYAKTVIPATNKKWRGYLLDESIRELENIIINENIPTFEEIQNCPNPDYANALYQGKFDVHMDYYRKIQERIKKLKKDREDLDKQ